MNPKGVNNLDPKLRQAYERIMGSSTAKPTAEPPLTVSPPQGQAPPQNTANQAPPQPPQPPVMQTQTVDTKPSASETLSQFQAPPQNNNSAFSTFSEPPANAFAQTDSPSTSPPKKKMGIPTLVVVLGAIVFLAVYAIVWAKIFGLF